MTFWFATLHIIVSVTGGVWEKERETHVVCSKGRSILVYTCILHHMRCNMLRYDSYMCGYSLGPSNQEDKLQHRTHHMLYYIIDSLCAYNKFSENNRNYVWLACFEDYKENASLSLNERHKNIHLNFQYTISRGNQRLPLYYREWHVEIRER